jgi:hypothetical protein
MLSSVKLRDWRRVATGPVAPVSYVAEDGTTVYVAEDGTTVYVTEAS